MRQTLMQTKEFGNEYLTGSESDISEIFYSESGLRIVIATNTVQDKPVYLEVFFEHIRGFRCLDEADLQYYWQGREFQNGYHVFQILKGGWLSGETLSEGILDVSSSPPLDTTEWFIATTNMSIQVLSPNTPVIREISIG